MALAALALVAFTPVALIAQTVRGDFYITNGQVNAEVVRGNTLYAGGAFTLVGPVTGAGVPVDATTGLAVVGFPQISGSVFAVASDGAGGWFVGGLFTAVDGVARTNLAHVLANHSVSSWNPAPNGAVRALVLDGSTLFVAGDFTTLAATTRNRIGAVDAITGTLSAWNPNANSSVRALALSGSTLFVGGQFTSIGGQNRNRIAALDTGTGLAYPGWNPNANSQVLTLWTDETSLLAGGQFTNIGGQTRNRIASLSLATGLANSWNPNANNQVLSIASDGMVVYAGGQFTTIGGQARNRIAALGTTTGLATAWNPNAGNLVQAMTLDDGTLYAGGDFLTIGGQTRGRIAALSTATGLASGWNPNAFSTVSAVAAAGTEVFLGGSFSAVGGVPRNNLAAFDVTTGAPTAWDPNANNQVQALLATPDAIYAGGNFSQIGGKIRNSIAALDLTNGLATSWDPNFDGQVSALASANGVIYAGGLFSMIGEEPRQNLAALDPVTGLPTPWDPGTDDQVFALAAGASVLYVGGNFSAAGGQARNFIAAIDPATGAATAWDPDASGTVRTIVPTCDRVYVGGFFTDIGMVPRGRLASLDPVTGQPLAWNPDANGPVFALVPSSGVIYVGGVMNMLGSTTRNRIAALDPQTGAATAWDPNSGGTVRSIAVGSGEVYIGGNFTGVDGVASGNLAAISSDASSPCPAIALTPPPLAAGVVGTAYSFTPSASGGTGPYCWSVSAGAPPPGISLGASSGQLSGTPSASGVYVFTLVATDVRGCRGSADYALTITPVPAVTQIAASGAGLCINPARACVSLPFVFTRGESTGLRAVSVTFQLEAAKLVRCGATAAASIHPGDWAAAFPNLAFEVIDNGGGSYTVDQVVLGQPCGIEGGGTLFTMDLAAAGPDGAGTVSVTSVTARDCGNAPVGVLAGAPASILISSTPIVVLPASLPAATIGAAYSQTFATTSGTLPITFAKTAGALPAGLALTQAGLLAGVPAQTGTFAFTVTATDAGGCTGARACTLAVSCPAIAIAPALLPDGAVDTEYAQTFTASAGLAPVAFTVSAGSLPAGLTLSAGGLLSGTPTTSGTSVFTIHVADSAGCAAENSYTLDIFATPPLSSVAANTAGLAISSANPCVSVPFEFTRGESALALGVSVTFQIDAAMLSLCTPLQPTSSVHLGPWFAGYTNAGVQVVDLGGGAYTVDAVLLGSPCGITGSGAPFIVDLRSVAGDGLGAITVTRVHVRDCGNQPIPVLAGAPAQLRILNTPIALTPPTLPNGFIAQAYSQTIAAEAGAAPFTFSISAGALPPGLTLSPAGVLAGTPGATGTFPFTVHVADVAGCPGSRSYSLSVSCSPFAVQPATLPDAQVGVAYKQLLNTTGGLTPIAWSISAGALPAGLTLSAITGEITGTPSAPGVGVFTVTATDSAGCAASEPYTLPAFTDPFVSSVTASTAGLCLSATRACVSVPFVYARGESAAARGATVTFHIDTARFALCTPGSPASSIHSGGWLASYSNPTFQINDLGGGSYTVDLALLGSPCGPTQGGVLFTADVQAVGGDGLGNIDVTEVHVRDCSNAPLPGVPGPSAQLVVSHLAPPAISDLDAAQVLAGNSGSTTGITVTWTAPAPGIVSLYRAPFGSYPEYDDLGGGAPDSALAPGAPWTLASADAQPGLVDHPDTRGFWHYVAFITDSCGNRSAVSNRSRGALDYHLGDVSDGVTIGTGDDRVALEDISLLGAHYGISGAALITDGVAYLDVGPTTDGQTTSRPVTDDAIGFEDLMVFAANFTVGSAPQAALRQVDAPRGAGEAFEVEAPSLVEPGDGVTAHLRLIAGGRMQGFSAALEWDASVVTPIATASAGWIEAQGGVVLSPKQGGIDAALLGSRGSGIAGSGEFASVTFRVLREGDAAIRLRPVVARDIANRTLDLTSLTRSTREAAPSHTTLLMPWPNPARGVATIAFALARAGAAELTLYSVDGRRVRTLASGPRAPGIHRIAWNGDDDARRPLAPGVYWARLEADGLRFTRRVVLLR